MADRPASIAAPSLVTVAACGELPFNPQDFGWACSTLALRNLKWPEYHSEYHSPSSRFAPQKQSPRKSLDSRGINWRRVSESNRRIGVLQAGGMGS